MNDELVEKVGNIAGEFGYQTPPIVLTPNGREIVSRIISLVQADCARELREFVNGQTRGGYAHFIEMELLGLADTWEGK